MKRQNYFKSMTNEELKNLYYCYIKFTIKQELLEEPLLKYHKKYIKNIGEKYAYAVMTGDLFREICRRFIQQDKCIWCE